MNTSISRVRWSLPLSFAILILYLALLAWSQVHHELWGDEIHSWNIAKASPGFSDLFQNIRYEGHPPLWYILLWLLSKCTHQPQSIQLLQYAIASLAIVLLIFRSPFPPFIKCILPFGYFLLYEYGTFSRNYAPALCFAFALMILLRENKAGSKWYYVFLFLLANTHLLGILLAFSIHGNVLISYRKHISLREWWPHMILGLLAIVPALLYIIPPNDSELNAAFWMKIWNKRLLGHIATAPLRSFLPLPAWWDPHFWNTHFMMPGTSPFNVLSWAARFTSVVLLSIACFVLRRDKNALRLFLLNAILTAATGLWFPLSSVRYVGFLYIGFLVALWLHEGAADFTARKKPLLYLLLLFQIPGTLVALYVDGRNIFSNAFRISNLVKKVPAGAPLTTDYNVLNPLLTFIDRPFYCLEAKREVSCILWTNELTRIAAMPDPYRNGADEYRKKYGVSAFYFLSSVPPESLRKGDSAFISVYHPKAVDSLTGAIERYSNYYLYQVGY